MMKKLILIFCILLITDELTAQSGIINVLPSSPTNQDNIQLVIKSGIPQRLDGSCGNLVNYSLVLKQLRIEIDLVFDITSPSNIHGCFSYDTISVGNFISGSYSIVTYWSLQDTLNNIFVSRSDSSVYILNVSTSTRLEKNNQTFFNVFPNPTTNLLTIQNSNQTQINQIQIWDLRGRLVKEIKYENEKIDVSDLPRGVYVLKVIGDKGSKEVKLVKR